jgi:hypothetical protein
LGLGSWVLGFWVQGAGVTRTLSSIKSMFLVVVDTSRNVSVVVGLSAVNVKLRDT